MKWNIVGAIVGILCFVLCILLFGALADWLNYGPNFIISLVGILVAVAVGGFIYNKIKAYGHDHGGNIESDEKFESVTNKVRFLIAGGILIFMLLIVIVPALTGIDLVENNSVETFNKSGVSFNYSGDWEIVEENNGSTIVSLVESNNDINDFSLSKFSAEGVSLDDFKNEVINQDSSFMLINISNTTINGLNAVEVNLKDNETYVYSVSFIKNDYFYTMIFHFKNISDIKTEINTIKDSFNIT